MARRTTRRSSRHAFADGRPFRRGPDPTQDTRGWRRCVFGRRGVADAALFGSVPSDSTLYRTYRQIDAGTLAGLWDAMAEVRADVWAAVDDGGPVVLDIDASLIEIHSEHKHGTAPTDKRGFGFHPMFRIPARKPRCSHHSSSVTGATTPTNPVTRSRSTSTCAPTPTSKTTSAA
jgi:hypothetical protein